MIQYDILFSHDITGGEKRWYRQSCMDAMDIWDV